jgi:Fe-S cluster assembly protein SufD
VNGTPGIRSPLAGRIAEEYERAARTAAHPAAARQRAALEALLEAGLPGSRDENWKYANLRPLERLRFVPPPAAPVAQLTAELPEALPGFVRQVFVDGLHAPGLSAALTAGAAQLRTLAGTA